MSRLIVKGLPARYEDTHLRTLFVSHGEVTDAKIIKTRDGRSRQFGFVGFRSKQEAHDAKMRLDGSYVDTKKIFVGVASAVGAESIPRPWSKYSAGSSRHGKSEQENEEGQRKEFLKKERLRVLKIQEMKRANATQAGNEELNEFQEIVAPRSKNPVWADGSIGAVEKKVKVASRKHGGEGVFLERKHVTFEDSDNDEDDNDQLYEDLPIVENGDSKAGNEVQEAGNETALNSGISDFDYFKTKMISTNAEKDDCNQEDDSDNSAKNSEGKGVEDSTTSSDENEDKKPDDEGSDCENSKEKALTPSKKASLSEEEQKEEGHTPRKEKKRESDGVDAGETGRLLVRNLAFSVTEEELEIAFEPFGTLADVHIVRDPTTSRSRGMAFVQYIIPGNAPKAMVSLDGTFHCGRILHVLPARPRPVTQMDGNVRIPHMPGSSSFKDEKDAAQKEAARRGLDGNAQHALHISGGGVANVVADRHGVSKAELFGTVKGESGEAAVRLAMAEATIQNEARKHLLEHGIDLSMAASDVEQMTANTTAGKRKRMSRTAFLVKNLPARTKETDLRKVFGRFGNIKRLVVVPSGLLAVVEYGIATDAKRAYNSLVYTKFGDTPLYLEWIASKALQAGTKCDERGDAKVKSVGGEEKGGSDNIVDNEEDSKEISVNRTSIYVKNLNFETRDRALKEHFINTLRKRKKLAMSVRSATVAMKKGREGKESEKLSMGFGFVEFGSSEDAVEAMKLVQNSTLDGHVLQLRLSQRDESNDINKGKKRKASQAVKKACNKLMVRNIAFEATRKDIRKLFSSFGQLKTVRLPKKVDGSHRGFAFVEFLSKGEATEAFEALSAAHLYGRHLVIEYAGETENGFASMAELQAQAAKEASKKRPRLDDGWKNVEETNEGNGGELDEEAKDALYA